MNYDKLYNAIDNRNMKVTELLSEMQTFGVKMSRSAFYRKMNGLSEFDRKEIEAIVKVLKLDESNANSIFFSDWVS